MPVDYNWTCLPAKKDKVKGRAKGGILVGAKKWIHQEKIRYGKGGMSILHEWRIKTDKWIGITVYKNAEWKELKKEIGEWLAEEVEGKEVNLVIIGDFNARIGLEGGRINEWGEERKRKSRDIICNAEGKHLVKWVEEKRLEIVNGGDIDNSGGDWTYVGHLGNTVIDYVITNQIGKGEIDHMNILDSILSDHQPIELILRRERKDTDSNEEIIKGFKRFRWGNDQILEFKRKIKEDSIV